MKRLAWVLLAAWCTAFAQVQPAVVSPERTPDCCCGAACACDKECPTAATLPVTRSAADRPSSTVQVRQASAVARQATAVRPAVPSLFAVSPAPTGATRPARVDAVPLFRRHCAFLI